ncbi:hypothetical protein Hanom_Chr12g01152031 [Helianthus anomalus]
MSRKEIPLFEKTIIPLFEPPQSNDLILSHVLSYFAKKRNNKKHEPQIRASVFPRYQPLKPANHHQVPPSTTPPLKKVDNDVSG